MSLIMIRIYERNFGPSLAQIRKIYKKNSAVTKAESFFMLWNSAYVKCYFKFERFSQLAGFTFGLKPW